MYEDHLKIKERLLRHSWLFKNINFYYKKHDIINYFIRHEDERYSFNNIFLVNIVSSGLF